METVRINMDEILFDYPSDLLDAYCYDQFGHTNWGQISDPDGNIVIKFNRKKESIK
jgi:hypothetical protein